MGSEQQEQSHGLKPEIGMVGSILFFATLFSLANPNQEGYEQFRKCHGNCVNGVLHAIGMPLAVSGVFMVVRSATDSPEFTRHLQFCVVTAYLYLYLNYETDRWSPWIFYVLYMGIFDGVLYRHLYKSKSFNRTKFLLIGLGLVAVNVGALETIGHGIFEHHHSYVLEFFNSVFHTPLYGINSVMGYMNPRPDHVCW
eukprot:scaffold2751_cov131-Cylindrotheca_fusiformis.AAC.10